MSFQQSLCLRLLSMLVNIVITRPYGFYRDRIVDVAQNLARQYRKNKKAADLIAYVSFPSPVYRVILLIIGANESRWPSAVIPRYRCSWAWPRLFSGIWSSAVSRIRQKPGTPR
ncbi:L-alanine exporter AlaE [Lonsdalea iberica]|uniref:L-alanine exporter AlaE n=1 Tax=Lonsdalea iberica TaxID=1082703 RepID=UPI003B84A3EE